jgi:hypothetical protein
VLEDNEVGHKDDGSLSLVLCEDVQKNEFEQPQFDYHCCACDDALYEVTTSCSLLIVNIFKLRSN